MRNEEKFFLPSPRRGERGKNFSAFSTAWRTRKKILRLPHGVANEEKKFSAFSTVWRTRKKIFRLPSPKVGKPPAQKSSFSETCCKTSKMRGHEGDGRCKDEIGEEDEKVRRFPSLARQHELITKIFGKTDEIIYFWAGKQDSK